MRQQYHRRKVGENYLIWDVNKLLKNLPSHEQIEVSVSEINEFNTSYWNTENAKPLTCKEVSVHAKLIMNCDLDCPILLCPEYKIMDGMHRVCKAYILRKTSIKAIRLKTLPPPDHKNVSLSDLKY